MDSLLLVALFIAAFLYASVGHGGASAYLAILMLWGMAPASIKPSSFLLNIFVAGLSSVYFISKHKLDYKTLLAYVSASVPLSFLAARMNLSDHTFKWVLGVALLIAVVRMLLTPVTEKNQERKISLWFTLLMGAGIGMLSGLIGIGGGILLTPVLVIVHRMDIKKAAGISAVFILLNSVSGLLSLISADVVFPVHTSLWLAIAIVGGWLGSYFGSRKFNNQYLLYILALVLLIASFKLMFL